MFVVSDDDCDNAVKNSQSPSLAMVYEYTNKEEEGEGEGGKVKGVNMRGKEESTEIYAEAST